MRIESSGNRGGGGEGQLIGIRFGVTANRFDQCKTQLLPLYVEFRLDL